LGNGEGFTIHTNILGGVFAELPDVGVGSRYTLFGRHGFGYVEEWGG